jgi:hypothetical protein
LTKQSERFVDRFTGIYGTQNYGLSTYGRQIRLFRNHVIPAFGQLRMQDISPLMIESFIADLRKKKVGGSKAYNKKEEEIPTLSIGTVRIIYSAIKVLFRKAVEWEVIETSPVICKKPSKPKKTNRIAWTKENVRSDLDHITNDLLHLAVHTAFFCGARNGEVMGIQFDRIDFDEGSYGSVMIDRTIERVDDISLENVSTEELIMTFPKKIAGAKTSLVLKDPKSDGSMRKLYLTKRLRDEYLARKAKVEADKVYYGSDYHDYNCVSV